MRGCERRTFGRDVMTAAAVGVLQLGGTTLASLHQRTPAVRPLDVVGYLLLGLGPLLLVWRGRFPVPVLLGVFAGTLGYALLNYPRGPIYFALIAAFVHAVVNGRRLAGYAVMVVGCPSLTWLVDVVTRRPPPRLVSLVGIAAWLLVLLVGSELIRIRRAFLSERRRRRRESELTHEEELRRRASEERLEIARELHDVMAHSISLINVQAGVALELMDQRPEQARQALTAIKAVSKDALVEVQSMLSVLRGTGEPLGLRTGSPALSLATLDDLVERVRLAGVLVETEVLGEPVPLTADVDQAAARIVQEALTNVARHAAGALSRVLVSYQSGASRGRLLIVVENDGPPRSGEGLRELRSGGRGISGMRERAQAFGGILRAGPRPEGGFRVHAELPIRPPAESPAS